MGFTSYKELTSIKRRAKARCIRALCQMEPADTVERAAEKHNVSRATAYNIVKELELWEQTATPQDEAREIMAQTRQTEYDPYLWLLTSGKLTMAYIQGHDGIGPELFGGTQESGQDLNADPLCE